MSRVLLHLSIVIPQKSETIISANFQVNNLGFFFGYYMQQLTLYTFFLRVKLISQSIYNKTTVPHLVVK